MDSDAKRAVIDFFGHLTPQLITAGRYAMQLQGQLQPRAAEKTGDAWTSAITDADIGVQQFIEAYLLAEFPHWGFYGEEHEATSNTRYFNTDADVRVMLDPINGTRLYRDGSAHFDLLISMSWRGRIVATMSYHPRLNRLYGSSAWSPSFLRTGERLEHVSALQVARRPDAPIGVYQASSDMLAAVRQVSAIFDFNKDYSPADRRCAVNSVFDGDLCGYLMLDCAMLDVGATAFAVVRSGGVATRPDGSALDLFENFDPTRREDLLVTIDPERHEQIAGAIRKRGGYPQA